MLSTYGTEDGAVVGKHSVVVAADTDAKCDCVLIDTIEVMQVEIKADEENTIEVVLKKNTSRQPVPRRGSDEE